MPAGELARIFALFGDCPHLRERLERAGFRQGAPAALLVNAEVLADPAGIAARCEAFVHAGPPGGEGLIVTIVQARPAGIAGWQARAATAGLLSFTRDAALSWGKHHIRLNMIEKGHDVPDADVAAAVMLMIGVPSMTGQSIRLGLR